MLCYAILHVHCARQIYITRDLEPFLTLIFALIRHSQICGEGQTWSNSGIDVYNHKTDHRQTHNQLDNCADKQIFSTYSIYFIYQSFIRRTIN